MENRYVMNSYEKLEEALIDYAKLSCYYADVKLEKLDMSYVGEKVAIYTIRYRFPY